MSVASHLGIRLDEYDERIRTFIPNYAEMTTVAATMLRVLERRAPHVVDLGSGTGALAAACLQVLPAARLTAIDEDEGMLDLARIRLGAMSASVSFVHGSFTTLAIPRCDAVVASLALHHVRTSGRKRQLYCDCRAALGAGGLFVTADCCPAADTRLAALERQAWRAHLRQSYCDEETDAYFAAWAREDVYFPLADELRMLCDAGLAAEVVWRAGPMTVIAARVP